MEEKYINFNKLSSIINFWQKGNTERYKWKKDVMERSGISVAFVCLLQKSSLVLNYPRWPPRFGKRPNFFLDFFSGALL